MEIKEYTEYRAEEILSLYTAVGRTAYAENAAALEQGYRHSLLVLAAYENGKLLGVVRAVGGLYGCSRSGYFGIPRTAEAGHRHGSALLQAVLNRYSGVRRARLTTDNTPATIAFYRPLGFLELAEIGCCGFVRG